MAFPKWLTPEGNLGVVPELEYYEFPLDAYDEYHCQQHSYQSCI